MKYVETDHFILLLLNKHFELRQTRLRPFSVVAAWLGLPRLRLCRFSGHLSFTGTRIIRLFSEKTHFSLSKQHIRGNEYVFQI